MTGMKDLFRSAVPATVAMIASRASGVVREMATAAVFGANHMLDVYLVAWLVPGIIFGVLSELIVAGAVPVFTRVRLERGSGQMASTVAAVFFWTGVAAVSICMVGLVLAHRYIALFAPGFSQSDVEQVAHLSCILFPVMAVGGLIGVSTGALNSAHKFFIPSFTPLLQNIAVVVAVLGLGRKCGVAALAYGLLVGATLQLLVQIMHMGLRSYTSREVWGRFRGEFGNVRETWTLAAIAAAVYSLNQLTMVTQRFFGSELGPGSISVLYYGSVVMISMATIISSLPAVYYPRFVEIFARSASEFAAFLSRSLIVLSLFTIPLAAYLLILPTPLIVVLFERGVFSPEQAVRTAAVVRAFAPALAVGPSTITMVRAFYTTGRARDLIYLGGAIVVVHFSMSYLLARVLGEVGLALATAAAFVLYLVGTITLFKISNRMGFGPALWSETLRIVTACAVSGIVLLLFAHLFNMNSVTVTTMRAIWWLVCSTGFFSIIYVTSCYACGVKELRLASNELLEWGRKQLHSQIE